MNDNNFDSNEFSRKDFNVSPIDPILVIDDYYVDKNNNFYDIHYDYEIGVVVKGVVTRTFRGKGKTLTPGDVWVTGIWEPHGFELEEIPSEMMCFILSPESLSKILPMGFNWIKIFSRESDSTPLVKEKYKPLILQACNDVKEAVDLDFGIALSWKANIVARILLYVVESNIEEYSKIQEQTENIVGHDEIKNVVNLVFSTNGMVTVNEAASQCMMSTSHFSRLFKKVTGVTFAKFALGHRIKQSVISLLDTSDPIKKIAIDWGFIDSSHYTKTFEKFFGISPYAFRKQSKENQKTRGIATTNST
ncbi:MAG: AraC family transcriptional regulator [Vallitaleaceae bacterium]|nr:AraC family transcriptional regulator [Vallitaleaceae bacterium]